MNNDRVFEVYKGELWEGDTALALRDRIHWIRDHVQGSRVLDIGCSQGVLPILLAEQGFEVVGVDYERPAIDYALSEQAKLPPDTAKRVTFLFEDAFALPDSLRDFDTVVLGEILEHLSEPGRLLQAALDRLHEDGLLVVTTPFGYFPHPDHKTTFYPWDFLAILPKNLQVEHFEISGNYIRFVGKKIPGAVPVVSQDEIVSITCPAFFERERTLRDQNVELYKTVDMLSNQIQGVNPEVKSLRDALAKEHSELLRMRIGKSRELIKKLLLQEEVDRLKSGKKSELSRLFRFRRYPNPPARKQSPGMRAVLVAQNKTSLLTWQTVQGLPPGIDGSLMCVTAGMRTVLETQDACPLPAGDFRVKTLCEIPSGTISLIFSNDAFFPLQDGLCDRSFQSSPTSSRQTKLQLEVIGPAAFRVLEIKICMD